MRPPDRTCIKKAPDARIRGLFLCNRARKEKTTPAPGDILYILLHLQFRFCYNTL